MKNYMLVILATAFLLSLAACGNSETGNGAFGASCTACGGIGKIVN